MFQIDKPKTIPLTVCGYAAEMWFGSFVKHTPLVEALAMGCNKRLGENSLVSLLNDDLLRRITACDPAVSLYIPTIHLAFHSLTCGSRQIFSVHSRQLESEHRPEWMKRIPDDTLVEFLYNELPKRKDPLTGRIHNDSNYGHTLTIFKRGGKGCLRLHFHDLVQLID